MLRDYSFLDARLKRFFPGLRSFGVYLLRRIIADECLKSAAMLAYVTLLAIVPLLTIAFSVLAAFPVFEGMTDRLRELLIEHLVPAAGEVVNDHLESFVSRAAELTAVGVVGLAVSSLLLLNNAERVLNGIWRVSTPRPALQRIMVYWTVLTVGPLLIGVAIVVTPGIGGLVPESVGSSSAVFGLLSSLAPFLIQAAVFALVYGLVPNCSVPVAHAVVGGAMAALLFEIAKLGFAQFVSNVPTYEAIYGALAALPIFLVWLYISWLVILLGAEIAHALGGYRRRADEEIGIMAKSVRYYVSGVVQGVCFRAYTQDKARELGLSGYVRNLSDGRVEVLASGEAEALEELQRWLYQGPPAARVEDVTSEQSEEQPSAGFAVR